MATTDSIPAAITAIFQPMPSTLRHLSSLLAAATLLVGTTASAAPDAPRIAPGVPYPTARTELIRQGWRPVTVLDTGDGYPLCEFNAVICEAFPEVTSCSNTGRAYCTFLYQRRKDGRYWYVTTEGEAGVPPDMRGLKYVRSGLEQQSDLEGLVIRTPAGDRFKFVYPKRRERISPAPAPIEPEGPVPLCRDVPAHTLPCWVKPPAK